MRGEDGSGMRGVVAEPVVEREAGEAFARRRGHQPISGVLERQEIIAEFPKRHQHGVEKARRHVEMPVRLKGQGRCGPNVMQGEDQPVARRILADAEARQDGGKLQPAVIAACLATGLNLCTIPSVMSDPSGLRAIALALTLTR